MRIKASIGAAIAAMSLTAASSAAAATEAGSNCEGNTAPTGPTTFSLSNAPGSALPVSAPGSGVVTKWRARIVPASAAFAERLRVFRATGNPNEYLTVAESNLETVVAVPTEPKINEFGTRIPVQAGDHFGAYGPTGTLACNTPNATDVAGIFAGDAAPGQTQTYEQEPSYQAAISVIIEPDADNDGYGDETQDKCPQNAALQTECPVISLAGFGLARRKSALVLAAASSDASVRATGVVRVPNTKRKKGKARSSALIRLGAGTKTIAPGQIARFNLRFSKRLRRILATLPRKRSLNLRVILSTTDLAGRASRTNVKVKLRGQKKPRRKKQS